MPLLHVLTMSILKMCRCCSDNGMVRVQWFWLLLYAIITIPFAPFVIQPIKFFR